LKDKEWKQDFVPFCTFFAKMSQKAMFEGNNFNLSSMTFGTPFCNLRSVFKTQALARC